MRSTFPPPAPPSTPYQLAVEHLSGVHVHDLEGTLAPERVLATLDGLLRLVLSVPTLARGNSLLEHLLQVVSEIELSGVSRVSLHDEHLDAGEVVSFLAVLDVNRDTVSLGGDGRGAGGNLLERGDRGGMRKGSSRKRVRNVCVGDSERIFFSRLLLAMMVRDYFFFSFFLWASFRIQYPFFGHGEQGSDARTLRAGARAESLAGLAAMAERAERACMLPFLSKDNELSACDCVHREVR